MAVWIVLALGVPSVAFLVWFMVEISRDPASKPAVRVMVSTSATEVPATVRQLSRSSSVRRFESLNY